MSGLTEVQAGSATDVGLVRANNQDSLLVDAPLFAVADGMGGHAAGEVASATAVAALRDAFVSAGALSPEALVAAARAANRSVWDQAVDHPELRGMGTTLVALAMVPRSGADVGAPRSGADVGAPRSGADVGAPRTGPDGAVQASDAVAVINVGDSRVYRLRDGELDQVTDDHSLVAELVAEGQLAEEEAEFHPQRHVLTRALGVDPDVSVDLHVLEPRKGDRYLLCSDGLCREVSDTQIASILRRLADPNEAARELVSEARLRGGSDNITVVLVDIGAPAVADAEKALAVADDATMAIPMAASTEALSQPDTTVVPAAATVASVDEADVVKATRRQRGDARRAERAAERARSTGPKPHVLTVRVVGFVVLLLGVVAIAASGIGWYARAGYYVGLQGNQLTVFQGRPGGLLWFNPTVARHTGLTTDQVEPRHLDELRAGKTEGSLSAANQYVSNLQAEFANAQRGGGSPPAIGAPTTAPATTVPGGPSTTAPGSGSTVPTLPAPTSIPVGTPTT
ncbi:MAG: protein phosphatase 2C domain-containing protein [Actinomycetota bacterium]|nr:protein phosphatase 2C domain-containing protein [Actinomycetota bacterium]